MFIKKQLALIIILTVLFHFNGYGQQLSSPYVQGVHSSIINSVEGLAALGAAGSGFGDVIRYRPVTQIEYYDGTNWINWDTEDYKKVLDGDYSSAWSISEQHKKFRFIIDLQGDWKRPSNWIVFIDWGGSNPTYSFTVESSDDQNTWTTRVDSQTTDAAISGFVNDTQTGVDRYIRLTFDTNISGTHKFNIRHISGLTKRVIYGVYPSRIDYDQNFLFTGNNVGIGTNNPTAKLAVNGTTKTKEIIVTDQSSEWPDYVFEGAEGDSGPRTDFEVLANYIKTHKHLPGIPTKEEVDQKGQNLGAIQLKLLKKIEELTLQNIQQHSEIEKQKRMNQELIKRVSKLEAQLQNK
jgi:hypothetical protein